MTKRKSDLDTTIAPETVRLLGVLAGVRWPNTVGKAAAAVRSWQDAGCPDATTPCPTCGERSHAAALVVSGRMKGGE